MMSTLQRCWLVVFLVLGWGPRAAGLELQAPQDSTCAVVIGALDLALLEQLPVLIGVEDFEAAVTLLAVYRPEDDCFGSRFRYEAPVDKQGYFALSNVPACAQYVVYGLSLRGEGRRKVDIDNGPGQAPIFVSMSRQSWREPVIVVGICRMDGSTLEIDARLQNSAPRLLLQAVSAAKNGNLWLSTDLEDRIASGFEFTIEDNDSAVAAGVTPAAEVVERPAPADLVVASCVVVGLDDRVFDGLEVRIDKNGQDCYLCIDRVAMQAAMITESSLRAIYFSMDDKILPVDFDFERSELLESVWAFHLLQGREPQCR